LIVSPGFMSKVLMAEGAIFVLFAKSTALRRFSTLPFLNFQQNWARLLIVFFEKLCGLILYFRNI